ncbi:MAG: MBL fold metallo-hydrolase [Candidatus Pacearchaeota archaeon]|nr:MAG: MBL fold metallo-hydrolase [Candidatus Pacearchaeota archaeon]
MKINSTNIEWLGHSTVKINTEEKVIYIDPYQLTTTKEKSEKADFILITHSHYDHCSQQDIQKIVKDGTIIICTADSQSKIARLGEKIRLELIEPGMEIAADSIKIRAIEAYNPNKKFHPKSEGWVGYIIQTDNLVIYHAGDTDIIKEMEKLTGYAKKGNTFIIFLPIGGTYTMNAEEAAKAASIIKPTLAIPMHYGAIVGSRSDAEKFVKLCKEQDIKAQILEKS